MLSGDVFGVIDDAEHGILQPYVVAINGSDQYWAYQSDPSTHITPMGQFNNTDDYPEITYAHKAFNSGKMVFARFKLTEEDYNRSIKEGSLLGLKWSTKVLKGTGASEGMYVGRHIYGEAELLPFNEWSGELLKMKLQTIAILSAIGVGTYYGGKLAYKKGYFRRLGF